MMNKAKILAIFLSLLLSLIATNSLSAPIKLLHCHIPSKKKQSNVQCIYSVYGQKIDEPKKFSKLYVNTNMTYALCEHALCDVNPNNPKYATCTCPIIGANKETLAWQRISVAPIYYEAIYPKYAKDGKLKAVPSAYSLASFEKSKQHKKTICKFDQPMPWANCFGARTRCKVYYIMKNGESVPMSQCRCKIVKTDVFVSAGPRNKEECKTEPNKVWSAATERQVDNDISVLQDSYRIFSPKSPHAPEPKEIIQDHSDQPEVED